MLQPQAHSAHGVRVGRSYPSPRVHAYERSLSGSPPLPDAPPKPLRGFEPPGRDFQFKDSDKQRALLSWTALRQRIALGTGPTADRWSTYPGDGLTPEEIVRCRREAHTGYPWRWAELCEQEIERNDVIKSRLDFRRAWVHQVPYRVDPPDHFKGDVLAEKMAAWCTALINGLRTCWPDAMHGLLAAPAYGWAACEQFWGWRDVSFTHEGKTLTVPQCFAPYHLKSLHQKKFIFGLDDDEPLLYGGQGAPGLRWPKGKVLFHRALGDHITERRGFMTAAVWIAWARQCAWRDLIIFMHLYGLPQFALMVEKEILEQAEEREILDEALGQYGQGKIPLFLKEAEVASLGQVTGDALHPEIINLSDNALSVLITGSILTQTQGTGTGSYDMHEGHAVTAHLYRVPDGIALDRSIGEHTLQPAVEFNIDALCKAFDAKPDEIRQRIGWFGWKAIAPAPTVQDHISTYQGLKSIGFPVSATEISQRTGCAIGQGEDRIGAPLGAAMGGDSSGPALELTPTQQGAIVQANEGRGAIGLAPDPKLDGKTVAEVIADSASDVAKAAAAESGQFGAAKPAKADSSTMEMERSSVVRAAVDTFADRLDPGVMIALYPPPAVAEKLALQRTEPEELHITLAYLGRRSQVDVRQVAQALQGATLGPSLSGQLGGIGVFPPSESSEGRAVIWVPVDVPGLAELRQAVVAAVDWIAPPKADHGWTPHLTLAYVEPGTPPPPPVASVAVTFDEIWLVCGEQRQRFPLSAQAQEST